MCSKLEIFHILYKMPYSAHYIRFPWYRTNKQVKLKKKTQLCSCFKIISKRRRYMYISDPNIWLKSRACCVCFCSDWYNSSNCCSLFTIMWYQSRIPDLGYDVVMCAPFLSKNLLKVNTGECNFTCKWKMAVVLRRS